MDDLIPGIYPSKDKSNRATLICCTGVIAASFTIITNFLQGNKLSALLIGILVLVLVIMAVIKIKERPYLLRYILVIILNVLLVLITLSEGLDAASTLYFFPVLVAIPFIIEDNTTYKKHLGSFFLITLISFSFCNIYCNKTSIWQNISEDVYRRMHTINSFASFVLCAIVGSLNIFLEKKYSKALLMQIGKTEEAMQARTRFLSNMGHELRTPLNGIIGAANLLRTGPSLPEQKDYLDILKYCSGHMLGLVNDILDFNKIEAGHIELHPVACNVKQLLKQSTLPFYNTFEEKKLELRVNIDERLDVPVLLDDLRLVQVINNLLSNALKFTERGWVKLAAIQKERKDNEVTIHFSVEDTGIGIKEAYQKKIFGSFWQVYNESTRKYDGTGLGLTICQRLLNLMKTTLLVESEEGKGSKFYFTITVPAIAAKKEKIAEIEKSNVEGLRVLLVEDNIINMMIAKKFLEDRNVILTTASNGREALECLEKDPHVDIILLDLEMPVMDGYTAITVIKQKYKSVPVLAFTAALMDQEMLQKLLTLGFLDYILKPFQPLDLYAKVRKYASLAASEKLTAT